MLIYLVANYDVDRVIGDAERLDGLLAKTELGLFCCELPPSLPRFGVNPTYAVKVRCEMKADASTATADVDAGKCGKVPTRHQRAW